MTRAKYRPYFSLPELILLRDSVQSHAPSQTGLFRYLSRYIRDIEDGIREPNHVMEPSIEEKLGIIQTSESTPSISPQKCYQMWQDNIPLTPAQITLMMRYRYENDLMSEIEEMEYEKSLMSSDTTIGVSK